MGHNKELRAHTASGFAEYNDEFHLNSEFLRSEWKNDKLEQSMLSDFWLRKSEVPTLKIQHGCHVHISEHITAVLMHLHC